LTEPAEDDLAAQVEATAPGYADEVRRRTAALGVTAAGGDVRAALAAVEEASCIDVDPPSPRKPVAAGVLKETVKRLCRWYLRYLGNQVVVLGRATVRLGEVLVERTDALEHSAGAMRRDLDQLAQRVERLEAGQVKER
jgi:hypothetical protein